MVTTKNISIDETLVWQLDCVRGPAKFVFIKTKMDRQSVSACVNYTMFRLKPTEGGETGEEMVPQRDRYIRKQGRKQGLNKTTRRQEENTSPRRSVGGEEVKEKRRRSREECKRK